MHCITRRRSAPAVVALAFVALAPAIAAAQRTATDSMHHDSTAAASQLPTVRVTAERAPRPEAASAVVVHSAAIRTTPATNAWDIVRQTAGVEVHQQGQGPGFASDAVIRGFTSDHSTDVAITIDGVPINEPINGHAEGYADWNQIMPEAVATIRVLKGPVSPWIGDFGMGGEIEVETLPMTLGTRWSAGTGSFGDARLSAQTGDIGEHGGWIAAGDAQRQDGWRRNSESRVGHLLLNRLWSDSSGAAFTVGAGAYGASWHSPGFLTLDQFARGDVRGAVDTTDGGATGSGFARAHYTRPLRTGTLTSLAYVRGGQWHLFLNIPPEGGIGEGAPSQTEELDRRADAGGSTRYQFPFWTGHLTWGIDYRAVGATYDRYLTTERRRDSTTTRVSARHYEVAPALEAHLNVTDRFELGVGGRVDVLRYASRPEGESSLVTARTVAVATPKLSALYHFTPVVSTYAAFNGGFRAADGVLEDPTLQPSREWASELGLRAVAPRYEGSIALYDLRVANEQTFNPVTLSSTANGSSRRRGIEADGRVGLTRVFALFAHATVNDAHYVRLLTEDGENLAGVPVYGVAREDVESGVDFQSGQLAGSFWAAYTGPFTPIGEPDVRTAPFTLLHFRAVAPLARDWSLALGVQNLLDRRAVELRASGFVSPAQPRTLLLALRHGR